MNIEKVGEPIRVLAAFSGGVVRPLRLAWGERTIHVDAVNGQWIDRQDGNCLLHYSVQAGDETYLVHFDSRQVQWWLDEVIVE